MTDHKPSNRHTPSLGGKRPRKRTGREPALSQNGSPRVATVGGLLEQLHSPVAHRRFNAVLALVDYPESPSGAGGIIRALRDDSLLVRLAAMFALHDLGPRLENPMLLRRAVAGLEHILNDPTARISVLAANTLVAFSRVGDAGAKAAAHPGIERLAELIKSADGLTISFSSFAMQALERIGTPEARAAVDRWLAHER